MDEEYGGMQLLLISGTHGKPGIIREPGAHGGLDILCRTQSPQNLR
jgi:hypothetical protein